MSRGVNIDHAKFEVIMRAKTDEAAMKGALAFRDRVRREILSSGRIRTGEMLRDIHVLPGAPRAEAGTAKVIPASDHFTFQDQGTHGSRMRPGGRVLRFMPKHSAVFVFARWTRPIPPAHFLEKARMRMQPSDFT